jgi:hypothetical protein
MYRLLYTAIEPQALVSFKKYMPPPLPCFKVYICPLPLPHFASKMKCQTEVVVMK